MPRKGRIRRKTRTVVAGFLDLMGPVDKPPAPSPERDDRPRLYPSLEALQRATKEGEKP